MISPGKTTKVGTGIWDTVRFEIDVEQWFSIFFSFLPPPLSFWSQNTFILLKIIENSKGLLFTWVVSISITILEITSRKVYKYLFIEKIINLPRINIYNVFHEK